LCLTPWASAAYQTTNQHRKPFNRDCRSWKSELAFSSSYLYPCFDIIPGVGGGFLYVPFLTSMAGLPMFLVAGTSGLVLVGMIVSIFSYMVGPQRALFLSQSCRGFCPEISLSLRSLRAIAKRVRVIKMYYSTSLTKLGPSRVAGRFKVSIKGPHQDGFCFRICGGYRLFPDRSLPLARKFYDRLVDGHHYFGSMGCSLKPHG